MGFSRREIDMAASFAAGNSMLYWILGGAALPALRSQILLVAGFSR